jgi:hypothetical protein
MAQTNAPDDENDEYELEPIDPEILAIEKARGAKRTESAVERIDVDELYGDTNNYSDLTVDLSQLKQFRFTTRHLLVLTAVLAIVMTLFTVLTTMKAVGVLAAVLLAGGWFYASQLERRQNAERARRKAAFFRDGDKIAEMADAALVDEAPRPRVAIKFAFSMKELFITMTVAAVAVAGFTLMGPEVVSLVFGGFALVGLIAVAMGVEPPPLVVLGWWLSLVIYLSVGFFQLMRAA